MCEQKGNDERIFAVYYLVVFHLLPLSLDVLGLWARWMYTNILITVAFNKQWKRKEKEIQQELFVPHVIFLFSILAQNCHIYHSPGCH